MTEAVTSATLATSRSGERTWPAPFTWQGFRNIISSAPPTLSHELAEVLLSTLRESVAAPVESMASMIAEAADGAVKVPTVLSRERHGKTRRAVVEAVVIAPTSKAANRFDGSRISVLWRA